MTITLTPDLEAALNQRAQQQGISVEALVLTALREKFAVPVPLEPRNDWERLVLGIGIDCGVSLSNEALSSVGLYE